MTTAVTTACEEHDVAGECTQECADFTASLTPGMDVPYDPTGCHYPAPRPYDVFDFDAVKRAVVRRREHPDYCQCGDHPDDWDGHS